MKNNDLKLNNMVKYAIAKFQNFVMELETRAWRSMIITKPINTINTSSVRI